MTIRWGVSPIGWINDDMPALGAGTTLDTILADAQAIGFEGVELGHLFPRDAATLPRVAAAHGLAVIGGWYGTALLTRDADAELAAMAGHLDLLAAVGADVVILAETGNAVHTDVARPMTATPRLAPGDWPAFGRRLDRIAERLAARGLTLAYHHHLGTVVETADDLERLLAVTGEGVRLTLDTGHATLGGIDPEAVARRWPRRIGHVHAKDVRRGRHAAVRDAGGSFLDGVVAGMFTTPGDGDHDFTGLARVLREAEYDGWIVIEAEQDPRLAEPRRYAASGLAAMQRLLR